MNNMMKKYECKIELKSPKDNHQKEILNQNEVLFLSSELFYKLFSFSSDDQIVYEGSLQDSVGTLQNFHRENTHWFDIYEQNIIIFPNLRDQFIVFFDLVQHVEIRRLPITTKLTVATRGHVYLKYDKYSNLLYIISYDTEKNLVDIILMDFSNSTSKQIYKSILQNLNVVRLCQGNLLLENQSLQSNPFEIHLFRKDFHLPLFGSLKDKDIILSCGFLDHSSSSFYMLFNKKRGKKSGIYIADIELDKMVQEDFKSCNLGKPDKGLQRKTLFGREDSEQDFLTGDSVVDINNGLFLAQGWRFVHLFSYAHKDKKQWIFTPNQKISISYLDETILISKSNDLLTVVKQPDEQNPLMINMCLLPIVELKPLYYWMLQKLGYGTLMGIDSCADIIEKLV